MRTCDVARKLGVSPSTIRKKERQGLIPPARRLRIGRQQYGSRRYTDEELEHIRQVLFGSAGESDESDTTPTEQPTPAVELVGIWLGRQHTINGTPYGPGLVKVTRELAHQLEANEAQAVEGLARERRSV
jgi:hypothetical protein